MKVSIVMPAYNAAKLIRESIDSVISQTYKNWELIVIDDGSKDNTADIVKSYIASKVNPMDGMNTSRIKLLQQKNAGSAAARNNGIRHASGTVIALLDSDDLWDPTYLEKQLAFMEKQKADLVYCSYRRIDENGKEILRPEIAHDKVTLEDMYVRNYIGCLCGLYNTERYGKVFLHEELKSIRDDYAYWIDVVKLAGVAYGNKEILASYRVFANSTTGKKFKLIGKQYYFLRNYVKLGFWKSILSTIRWGIVGFRNFYIGRFLK